MSASVSRRHDSGFNGRAEQSVRLFSLCAPLCAQQDALTSWSNPTQARRRELSAEALVVKPIGRRARPVTSRQWQCRELIAQKACKGASVEGRGREPAWSTTCSQSIRDQTRRWRSTEPPRYRTARLVAWEDGRGQPPASDPISRRGGLPAPRTNGKTGPCRFIPWRGSPHRKKC